MPLYKLDDEIVRLRDLSDEEYDWAREAAEQGDRSLSVCPTCLGAETYKPPGSGGEVIDCKCPIQMALFRHYLVANIPEQYMRLDWNTGYKREGAARNVVERYIDSWNTARTNGMGINFNGPLGVGKTWASTHIGKSLVKRGGRVFFIRFDKMVSAFERNGANWIEDRMYSVPFVILDEIVPPVSDRQHDFYASRLETIIRHRTDYNLPTITTSNLSEEDVERWYPRIYSLLSAKQLDVSMNGEDARTTELNLENLEIFLNEETRPIT